MPMIHNRSYLFYNPILVGIISFFISQLLLFKEAIHQK